MSGCRGLMAKHWWLKPKVVRLPAAVTGLFTFLYFGLITSKFLYTPYSSTPCFVGGLMIKHLVQSATVCTLVCAKLNSILPCYKTSLDRHTESVSVDGMCVTTLLTRCYLLWAHCKQGRTKANGMRSETEIKNVTDRLNRCHPLLYLVSKATLVPLLMHTWGQHKQCLSYLW